VVAYARARRGDTDCFFSRRLRVPQLAQQALTFTDLLAEHTCEPPCGQDLMAQVCRSAAAVEQVSHVSERLR